MVLNMKVFETQKINEVDLDTLDVSKLLFENLFVNFKFKS